MQLTEKDTFVCFSIPGTTSFELMTGNVKKIPSSPLPSEAGFIVSPFKREGWLFFLRATQTLMNPMFSFASDRVENTTSFNRQEYKRVCKKYIRLCASEIDKIILSRIKSVPAKRTASELFHGFRLHYPNAFVYMLHTPETGTWIGASPEVFLFRNEQRYATMALAGTQGAHEGPYEWLDKERNEQQVVTDFIYQELTQLGIDATKDGPHTTVAGNIAHLCTEFNFSTEVDREKIVTALHPTPAVCGFPKGRSEAIILNNEPHDRELYCGYLGPVNIKNSDQLFVNLRCLKATKDTIHLFVGGGITADSDPDKEWLETEMKAQTLLGVIEKM